MKFIFKRTAICLMVSTSLIISGCASTGSSMTGNQPATDSRLTNGQEAEFFSASGFQACAAAAGIGIAACMFLKSEEKTQCSIKAGIAACGVAMGANYYLDSRRAEYANTTERLQAMDRDIQKDTEVVVARTNIAKQVIADNSKTLTQIAQDKDKASFDKALAQRQLGKVDADLAQLKKELTNMRKKATEYQQVAKSEQSEVAETELAMVNTKVLELNKQISLLEQEVNGLYDQRSAITVG
ncbi:hypothetical protein [Shewanella sp. SW24]|uniref:hypothetical protein n=1 Tax=Shewanella TaxID=22 RepID=UPI0021D92297|nr:hypothetical protein [Shewanella sp. SW24]MCU7986837.1 hypothetical protein [Shewanella sp. SW24]